MACVPVDSHSSHTSVVFLGDRPYCPLYRSSAVRARVGLLTLLGQVPDLYSDALTPVIGTSMYECMYLEVCLGACDT